MSVETGNLPAEDMVSAKIARQSICACAQSVAIPAIIENKMAETNNEYMHTNFFKLGKESIVVYLFPYW